MYRHTLFVTILLLCTASAAAGEAGGAKEGRARIAAPAEINDQGTDKRAMMAGKSAVHKKTTRRSAKKSKQKTSEFVRLGHLVLYDTGALNQFQRFGAKALDPVIAGRTVITGETPWTMSRIDTGGYLDDPFPARNASSKVIEIKPLDLEFGAFNPFLGDFFRPLIRGRFHLTSDDMAPFGGIVGRETQLLYLTDEFFQDAEDNSTDLTVSSSRTPFAYSYTMDKKTSVNAGLGWIPDLGDTKGISSSLADPEGEGLADKLSGVNLILEASYSAFTLTGGYVRALDNRTSAELALEGNESDPIAWISEIAYSTELLRKETILAVGYQKSSDALQYYLPEERYRTRASMALSNSTTFSLEYYQDKDYAAKNGEDDGYGITTRIGFDF